MRLRHQVIVENDISETSRHHSARRLPIQQQIAKEMTRSFAEVPRHCRQDEPADIEQGSQPRVFVLDNPHVTAEELINGDYDMTLSQRSTPRQT
jgi:hypothetical protein